MKKKAMEYKMKDGTIVPLFEAPYDMSFKVWKSDKKKAIIGHPNECIEALGICRMPHVLEAWVGSGKVAYAVFERSAGRPFKHALRFVIKAQAQKVRDLFEIRGAPKTQIIMLHAPTPGRTLSHLAALNRRRHQEIKNGSPVKHHKHPENRRTRIHRIGVAHRPRAQIKSGIVSFELSE